MNDWNIQSRAHACEACQQSFVDRQPYFTALLEERHELRRQDLCAGCWQSLSREITARPSFISHWQGVYESPPPVTEPIQKETAETLLKKLVELNDPKYVPAGFILAVMLERKRVLKVKEQIVRDGKRTLVYEQPKTGEILTITDPDLHLDQLEEVQRDVAHLLEHGLNPPPATEITAGPPAVAETRDQDAGTSAASSEADKLQEATTETSTSQ